MPEVVEELDLSRTRNHSDNIIDSNFEETAEMSALTSRKLISYC